MATAAPSASPLGPIGLPALVGPGEGEPFGRRLRPLCGWATITPWRVKIRHTVDREGTPGFHRAAAPTRSTAGRDHVPLDQLLTLPQHRFLDLSSGLRPATDAAAAIFLQPGKPLLTETMPPLVERFSADLPRAAKRRHVLHLPGQRRRGTNIIAVTFWAMNHRGPSPTQVSAMSRDIQLSAMSRNRTLSLSDTNHAEIAVATISTRSPHFLHAALSCADAISVRSRRHGLD